MSRPNEPSADRPVPGPPVNPSREELDIATQKPHIYQGQRDDKHWFVAPTLDSMGGERYFIPVGRPLSQAEQAAIDAAQESQP